MDYCLFERDLGRGRGGKHEQSGTEWDGGVELHV